MLGDVLAQPHQLGDALWRAQSAGLPKQDRPGGLVVCGMGGSAIGGDLAAAALGDRATRPITTVRGYALESWTGPDSLVLCASYSGDTEETLACFEAAGAAGARRVALTTGGELAEAARAEGVPVIGVPAGHAAARGRRLHDRRRARVRRRLRRGARAALGDRHRRRAAGEPGRASGARTPRTARRRRRSRWSCDGTVPVVHGAGPTAALARRWKTQINENAKAAAFWSELPEANHNEICGWERGRERGAARRRVPRGPRPAPARSGAASS